MPVVLTGASSLLPKRSLIFDQRAHIRVRVLPPVPSAGLGLDDCAALAERVRGAMVAAFDALERG